MANLTNADIASGVIQPELAEPFAAAATPAGTIASRAGRLQQIPGGIRPESANGGQPPSTHSVNPPVEK